MEILAVIVRYKTPLDQSETMLGLSRALSSHPELTASYKLLVWDNTIEALTNPQLPIPFVYCHSAVNLGVSGAYNGAIEYATQHGHTWMMLLDQDTKVDAEFLKTMLRHTRAQGARTEIAAVAPTVRVGSFTVSPRRQLFNRSGAYPAREIGIAAGEAFAINSGCVVRVTALEEIGGFSSEFWLDYSDMYVFHQFFLSGKKIWRAADTELEHDMSIMDYDRLMTPARYKNFCYAETAFHDLYKGSLERFVQTLRLLARAMKQRRKYKNSEFSRIAWEQLLFHLRVRRKERLGRWSAEAARRNLAARRVIDKPTQSQSS